MWSALLTAGFLAWQRKVNSLVQKYVSTSAATSRCLLRVHVRSRYLGNGSVRRANTVSNYGTEDTFSADIFTLDPVRVEINALATKIWRFCEAKNLTGRTVTLKVKYSRPPAAGPSSEVRGARELAGMVSALLEPLFPVDKGIRLLGVTLSSLETEGERTIS